MIHSPTTASLLLTTLALLGLTAIAWRFRDEPGVKLFGVLQALSAVWAAVTVVGLSLSPGPLRLRVWGVTTGLSLVVIVFWFGFIVRYTGREEWLTARRFGVASIPLVLGAAVYVLVPSWSPLVGQLTQETIAAGTVVQSSVGLVGAVLGVYIYLVFAGGLVLVGRTMREGHSLFVGQIAALALGTVVTVLASLLSIAGVPTDGYPTTQVALGIQTLFWGYAVFGQQFLQTVPAVAIIGERTVLEDIDEGVLVFDSSGTVTRANAPVREYLDVDEIVGRSVGPLFDQMGVAGLGDLPTRFQSGRRTYRTKASPITDWRGETIGHALVLQDVTQLLRRQQRLQVMNRILRHNVRNSMNVVLGVGNQLQRRSDDRLADRGEILFEKAQNLTTISEKAIEIDRMLDDSPAIESVDIEATVEDVVSSLLDEHPEATVTTRCATSEVRTDRRMLSVVLKEVVENALEHTGDAPVVEIETEREHDQTQVTVTDDGPGIPQTEVDPVTEGEETDLRHASSLGLWLVHWGTWYLGGEVDIETTESGSTVSILLPDANPADEATSPRSARAGATDD